VQIFRLIGAQKKSDRIMVSIGNTLEEYYNCRNRYPINFGRQLAKELIPPEAEEYRHELKLYIEALRHGITDFKSTKDFKDKLGGHAR
jgi:hypothetical protein